MPKDKSPGKVTTRRYTGVEKERAVRLCRQLAAGLRTNHGVVSRIANQHDFGVESIQKWWLDANIDEGLACLDAQRVRDLEAENEEMSEELREFAPGERHLAQGVGFLLRRSARPPTQVIVDFTDAPCGAFGVEPICTALQYADIGTLTLDRSYEYSKIRDQLHARGLLDLDILKRRWLRRVRPPRSTDRVRGS